MRFWILIFFAAFFATLGCVESSDSSKDPSSDVEGRPKNKSQEDDPDKNQKDSSLPESSPEKKASTTSNIDQTPKVIPKSLLKSAKQPHLSKELQIAQEISGIYTATADIYYSFFKSFPWNTRTPVEVLVSHSNNESQKNLIIMIAITDPDYKEENRWLCGFFENLSITERSGYPFLSGLSEIKNLYTVTGYQTSAGMLGEATKIYKVIAKRSGEMSEYHNQKLFIWIEDEEEKLFSIKKTAEPVPDYEYLLEACGFIEE